jgi:uncharacterized membrane protein YqaE (UPF0057 family)
LFVLPFISVNICFFQSFKKYKIARALFTLRVFLNKAFLNKAFIIKVFLSIVSYIGAHMVLKWCR